MFIRDLNTKQLITNSSTTENAIIQDTWQFAWFSTAACGHNVNNLNAHWYAPKITDYLMRIRFAFRVDSPILEKTLLPMITKFYPNGHRFIQDNDPKHTSAKAQHFFNDHGVNWRYTPPESPDWNPSENMWHELKRAHWAKWCRYISEVVSNFERSCGKIQAKLCRSMSEVVSTLCGNIFSMPTIVSLLQVCMFGVESWL